MRLWLLSHLQDSPGNALVLDAARRAGHDVELVDPSRLQLELPPTPAGALYGADGPLTLPERVFTRMGSSAPPMAHDVLHQLETAGVRCVNQAGPLSISRDKARTFQVLAQAGVPLPQTIVLGRRTPLDSALARLGPPPWILKLPVGTQGVGVSRVDSPESLRTVVDMLHGLEQRVLLQRYVEESAGTDIRVLVVGGQALAAMRRRARPGEVRSNLHQGGAGEGVALLPEWSRVAESAASAVGLEVAGVDLLPSRDGPVVCEVNGSPGLEGLQRATGEDLATRVIEFVTA